MEKYIVMIGVRLARIRRRDAADVCVEFLQGAMVSGKYAIRRMQKAVRCFQRVARCWIASRHARLLALDRALVREERRFAVELGDQRRARQSAAIRHLTKDPMFSERAIALETANTRLAKLLSVNGGGVVAKRLRRQAAHTNDAKAHGRQGLPSGSPPHAGGDPGADAEDGSLERRSHASSGRGSPELRRSPEAPTRQLAHEAHSRHLLHVNPHLGGGDKPPDRDDHDYVPMRRHDRRHFAEALLVDQRRCHQDASYEAYYTFLNNMHMVDKEDVRKLLSGVFDVDDVDERLLLVRPEYATERFPPFLMLTRPEGCLGAIERKVKATHRDRRQRAKRRQSAVALLGGSAAPAAASTTAPLFARATAGSRRRSSAVF